MRFEENIDILPKALLLLVMYPTMHKNTLIFISALLLLVLGFVFMSDSKQTPSILAPEILPTQTVDLTNGNTYDLVASYVTKDIAGKKVKMLAYNGMIPGPTLRVREGDQVTIRFTNKTDIPTLLHSHGVRMENKFDGSHLVQPDIASGESFDYVLKFTDPGVYWYHPHVREDKQQVMGLYGNFVVLPNDTAYWPPVDREDTLFLSDILMEDGDIAPYSDKYITHALMGRFGNVMLTNGAEHFTMNAAPGEVHRFYVTNAATVRPFDFRVSGAQMKLIGSDNGRYEKETFVNDVILSPSERAVIDVYFPTVGTYAIEHVTPLKVYTLGSVNVSGVSPKVSHHAEFMTLRTNEAETKTFMELRHYLSAAPNKTLHLTTTVDMTKIMSYPGAMSGGTHAHGASGTDMPMDMSGMTGMNMGDAMMGTSTRVPSIEWEDQMGAMNTYSTSDTVTWILRDEATGKENMDIDWKFALGDLVKVRIINDNDSMHPMQHPIHFHGNRFVVLATNGVPNDNMVWKDTTLLRTGDIVDILLEASNAGKWLAHCHIAEHMHSGMMLTYSVE
jgi:FtsP/CotA-like multicopper oxidase with cupredoxin domain